MTVEQLKLRETQDILARHREDMEKRLDAVVPRADSTGTVKVCGRYPIYVIRALSPREPEFSRSKPFQLQYYRHGHSSFAFTRGKIQAGSFLVVPTIGGVPVDDEPPPTLPILGGGGQVFAEYRWTLNPAFMAPAWDDVFVSCELIQVGLNAAMPTDVLPTTGTVVSVTEGIAYGFIMAYDSNGRILTYGQTDILPPDPDNFFPTDFVKFVLPLMQYVA